MQIVTIKIDDLKDAEYNPRQMTEKQVEDLKASMTNFGLVEPIVVNSNPDRFNVIVGGHQRAKIARMLGLTELPVVYVNLTLEREKELNIRLNKNTGEFNWESLANNFDNEDLLSWGFNESELGLGSSKDDIDTDDLSKTLDSYLDGNIRQIVLYFKTDEYADVLGRLEAVMAKAGVENHTEAFLKMLTHYENNTA